MTKPFCRTTAKEKKPSYSRQFDTPIWNGGFDFQSRRFFAFAQTYDDLQGDCGVATKEEYVEILEFTHFVEFFSFNRITENHKEKELVRKVTVVVVLDLGCGNTNNSEYESK